MYRLFSRKSEDENTSKQMVYDEKYDAFISITKDKDGNISSVNSFVELLRYPLNKYQKFYVKDIKCIEDVGHDLLSVIMVNDERITVKGNLNEILEDINRWSIKSI